MQAHVDIFLFNVDGHMYTPTQCRNTPESSWNKGMLPSH